MKEVNEIIFNNTEYTLLRTDEVGRYFGEPWFEEESIPIVVKFNNGTSSTTYLIPVWRSMSVFDSIDSINRMQHE